MVVSETQRALVPPCSERVTVETEVVPEDAFIGGHGESGETALSLSFIIGWAEVGFDFLGKGVPAVKPGIRRVLDLGGREVLIVFFVRVEVFVGLRG